MAEANKDTKVRFKEMMNKEKSKVLFAEADSDFADILLSFLTLPLGRIIRILEKEYGDKAPAIGSLSNLCRSIANLDRSLMDDAKKTALLNPRSSFEAEYQRLKLDITAPSSPAICICRWNCSGRHCFRTPVAGSDDDDDDGVFILKGTSFLISDDLQIFPSETGLLGIMKILGITDDMDEAEQTLVEFGLSEVMSLLKASLTSSTPLSDVILNRTLPPSTPLSNVIQNGTNSIPPEDISEQSPTAFRNVSFKVTIQRSTGKLLQTQAKEGFLLGLLHIPLGRADEHLQGGKTSFKAINSLYRSAAELIDENYFKKGMKTKLMKLDSPQNNVVTEPLLSGQRGYQVMDDLTVVPFSVMSMISTLKEQKIAISDVEEVELQIGLKEHFSIVKASLSSTTVLTDALMTHIPNKRVKRET